MRLFTTSNSVVGSHFGLAVAGTHSRKFGVLKLALSAPLLLFLQTDIALSGMTMDHACSSVMKSLSGDIIQKLQISLAKRGYYKGPFDKKYSFLTRDALENFHDRERGDKRPNEFADAFVVMTLAGFDTKPFYGNSCLGDL